MSTSPTTSADSGDCLAPCAQDTCGLHACLLPATVVEITEATRALEAVEAEALAKLAALCDTFEAVQVDPNVRETLRVLRLTISQAAQETRELLLSLEGMVDETRHLNDSAQVRAAFTERLAYVEGLCERDAATQSLVADLDASALPIDHKVVIDSFARLMSMLDSLPAALTAAVDSSPSEVRMAVEDAAA